MSRLSYLLAPALGTLATVMVAFSPSASAALIDFDAANPAASSAVMTSRYRLSPTNWDHVIAVGSGVSGSTIVQQQNLGTAVALNGRAWDFSMAYTAGSGYRFTLTDTTVPPLGSSPSTVAWAAPFGAASPTAPFNAIELFAQAQNNLQAGVTGLSIALTNLSFVGAGITSTGTLDNMLDTHLLSPSGSDFALQWLVADGDLSLFNWVLSGRVQSSYTGTVPFNFDERLKFDIKTAQVAPVPLPAALPLLLAGLGVMGWVGRRRSARV